MVAIKKDEAMAENITDGLENSSTEDKAKMFAQKIQAPWNMNTIKKPRMGYFLKRIFLLL